MSKSALPINLACRLLSTASILQVQPRLPVLLLPPRVASSIRYASSSPSQLPPRKDISDRSKNSKTEGTFRGHGRGRGRVRVAATLLAGVGLVSTIAIATSSLAPSDNKKGLDKPDSDDTRDPSLPRFRLSEVRKHDGTSSRPWVTYEDKVYNITDWVPAHPGGDVILRAAGGPVDRYWDIFSIHKASYVREILDQYLIGFVHAADLIDGRPSATEIDDPFASDPPRDPALLMRTEKPCNAETPGRLLDAFFLTPNPFFFVRSHMWVPTVDPARADAHMLTVQLLDGSTRDYTLAELKARFPCRTVVATLQCSGNRRSDMSWWARATNGLQWRAGAISTARWEGVRLADVLADAGFPVDRPDQVPDARHVHLVGLEAYGASIPLAKAVDPRGDVLLAWAMNGAPLPPDHGFPLRAIVPGHVAARSVKWLRRIAVSDEESPSQWQRRDYKCFGPNHGQNVDWDSAPAIQELPINSAITSMALSGASPSSSLAPAQQQQQQQQQQQETSNNSIKETGFPDPDTKSSLTTTTTTTTILPTLRPATIRGYAFSGGGREIIRVDVSTDGGRTWDQARLLDGGQKNGEEEGRSSRSWAWCLWEYEATVAFRPSGLDGNPACAHIVVKATDNAYNTQPTSHSAIYNARGNLANAWHTCLGCLDSNREGGVRLLTGWRRTPDGNGWICSDA